MGAAAYRRGSKAIREGIDRSLYPQPCGGVYENNSDKSFSRCRRCGTKDYEKYEGDKCNVLFREVK